MLFFLEILFWCLGHVTIKCFTKILWLWYIYPIFSILRIVLNIAFDEKYKFVFLSLFMTHWNILLKWWHLEHFLKKTLSNNFLWFKNFHLSTQATIIQNRIPVSGHATLKYFSVTLKFWMFLKQTLSNTFLS